MKYRPEIWKADDCDDACAHIADWKIIRQRAFDEAAKISAATVLFADECRYAVVALDTKGRPFQFEFYGETLTHNSFTSSKSDV